MNNRKSYNLFYIPNWVLEKGKLHDLTITQLLNPKILLDTISKTDVDKYLADQLTAGNNFKLPISYGLDKICGLSSYYRENFPLEVFFQVDALGWGSQPFYFAVTDIPFSYHEIPYGTDSFLDAAASFYTKDDGTTPKYGVFPELIYVDGETIVMTIARIDTAAEKHRLIEKSMDTLFAAGFTLSDLMTLPFSKYLVNQATVRASTLN